MNEQLKKRLKGFGWGLLSAVVITGLTYTVEFIPNLGLPEFITLTVILLAEQVTKFLNK